MLLTVLSTVSILLTSPVLAASGELLNAETASGTIVTDGMEERRAIWQERANLLKQGLLRDRKEKAEVQYRSARASYAKKRWEHARLCRRDLREANRDTKLATGLRCYRGALTQEREFRKEEKSFVLKAPGVTEEQKFKAFAALDALTDAIGTIIDAVDSGVYERLEDLSEAKQNLHTLYRVKAEEAIRRLRARQLLAWIARMILKTEEAARAEPGKSTERIAAWENVLNCFLESEEGTENALEDANTLTPWKSFTLHLRTCSENLTDILEEKSDEEMIAPNGT